MNTFGNRLKFTSFGESHGAGIGCVIDGFPSGVKIDKNAINKALSKRAGGKSAYKTPRKETDEIEILSGVFEGFSTGTPIAIFVKNQNQKSKDYSQIKDIFRPGHADFTYFAKYGIRDFRGGGRSSARESIARVVAGAVAEAFLSEFDINVNGFLSSVGEIDFIGDFDKNYQSDIFAPNEKSEILFKDELDTAIKNKDSLGASAIIKANGVMAGLGEGIYDKLDAKIANAFMGLNAVKAVEIGAGIGAAKMRGSQNNDEFCIKDGKIATKSNNCGGILGGISTGGEIIIKTHFKPTPSILKEQNTINANLQNVKISVNGRHDPCVGIRGVVVLEAMLKFILADCILLNATAKLENIKKIYF